MSLLEGDSLWNGVSDSGQEISHLQSAYTLVLSQVLCVFFHIRSLVPRPFHVSACVSNHTCAYVGQATDACVEAIYARPNR